MTLKTKSAITTEITSNLATNGTGAITATLLRQVVQDIVDSYTDWTAAGSLNFTATGVNFNSANTDTPITITLPTGFSRYRVSFAAISGASASISTATCGLFTATGGGGTAIVTSATAITVTSASENTNANFQSLTINNANTQSFNLGTLYFRVQTAQGSAATANVNIIIFPVS